MSVRRKLLADPTIDMTRTLYVPEKGEVSLNNPNRREINELAKANGLTRKQVRKRIITMRRRMKAEAEAKINEGVEDVSSE